MKNSPPFASTLLKQPRASREILSLAIITLGSIALLEIRSWPPLSRRDSSDLANMPSAKPSTVVPLGPKPKTASSFRERLFLGTKNPSPVRPKTSVASVQNKPHRKVSIAPIFKLNHIAAFQEGPNRQTWMEQSPDTEPDVLINKLKSRSRGTPGFAVSLSDGTS